ncbi:unnamed protein product [Bursaphelenchus okinawaensis]|uniref:Uncharacterized protein n=1 Tax=Bursaphelenchus okinawaensis TaxID=465554 RepID=A0A811K5I9_9BILA|nr:unnamed protein product [Bursaphelenchus okinawaensis]CAG9091820.1 unnamed protein product [Bursaphelenchus okinawaensis]
MMEAVNFICWLAFIALIIMGKVKYRQHLIGDVKNKYQISVCLRTLAVLKVMAICSAVRNFVCINVLIILYVWVRPYNDLKTESFFSFFYDLTLSFYSATVPFLMIHSHREMQRTCNKMCCTTIKPRKSVTFAASTASEFKFVAYNVVGDIITVNTNETAFHFEQLETNWNKHRLSVQHTPHILTHSE